MSIDFAWRRIAVSDLDRRRDDPESVRDLVPSVFAAGHDDLRRAGAMVSMGDEGAVIGALLSRANRRLRLPRAAARAFTGRPDDWDDDYLVGTLDPATVHLIAAAVAEAPWPQWLDTHFDGVVQDLRGAGFASVAEAAARTGPWADHLLRAAAEVSALFLAAAEAGEAVVVTIDG